ncbi:hypothetical protein MN608_10773 [Microdochium nivale]|nr:hypothetical protein MN608_10773 [Microdochium nivale]
MGLLTAVVACLALATSAQAACGDGSPDAKVTGASGAYVATVRGANVYSGADYRVAIQTALDRITSGQRVSVIASGSIGANTITIASGKIFEGCGTINVAAKSGRGAIESTGTTNVQIPYLTMTGNPYFGLRFFGTSGLSLGVINLNLSGGLGIRFDRDQAANKNVKMNTINVTGAGSHAVETWNIDGLTINKVVARNVGECGLLLQATTNARIGTVDGQNVAAGNGYATFRMANRNGRLPNGSYGANVFVDSVISRGGGRGIFCVSESGGVEIGKVDLANNGGNSILIENCYGVNIKSGVVKGGGEIRMAARSEFKNNDKITVALTANDVTVRESPCGTNVKWTIAGNAAKNVC